MSSYVNCRRCGTRRLRTYHTRVPDEATLCPPCRTARRSERDINWMEEAACRGLREPDFFTENNLPEERRATAICKTCHVTAECLQMALEENIWHGIWGGLTAEQRSSVKAKKPLPKVQPLAKPAVKPLELARSKPVIIYVHDEEGVMAHPDARLARCRNCGGWTIDAVMSDGLCKFCYQASKAR